MRLTKAIKQKHYDLWDWLQKDTSRDKINYPKWISNGGKIKDPRCLCFLCPIYIDDNCEDCPLKEKGGVCCSDKRNWFNKYNYSKKDTRKKYAKLIRDIFIEEVR
jgi:hypothetical protein